MNGFRRQRSHSFISGFLPSLCSGSNLEVTIICLIWKSLPNHFDMLHPSMFNYKLLSPIVDIICFSFPQILVSVFQISMTDTFTDTWNFEFAPCIRCQHHTILGFYRHSDIYWFSHNLEENTELLTLKKSVFAERTEQNDFVCPFRVCFKVLLESFLELLEFFFLRSFYYSYFGQRIILLSNLDHCIRYWSSSTQVHFLPRMKCF